MCALIWMPIDSITCPWCEIRRIPLKCTFFVTMHMNSGTQMIMCMMGLMSSVGSQWSFHRGLIPSHLGMGAPCDSIKPPALL